MFGKVFQALFVLVMLERTAAEQCKAHLSYMQLLREELKDTTSDSSLPLKLDSSKLKGNLLAASFDPIFIEGEKQLFHANFLAKIYNYFFSQGFRKEQE